MSEIKNFALVRKPSSAVEKTAPGAKRILSGMIADTHVLAKNKKRRKKIVVLDDVEGPREYLRAIFKDKYDLFFAEDGPMAIELAKQHDIEVAILSVSSTKMSGIEVLKRLKISNPDIEVIMTTAFETNDTIRESLRLGACDYINKPFDIETISSAVGNAVQHHTRKSKKEASQEEPNSNIEKLAGQSLFKHRGKLLIVDDEDSVREYMRIIFENEYDLFVAGDGLMAFKLARQHDIDVTVTNINMSGMSGIELLEQLKLFKPEIEVIIFTGLETRDTLLKALRLRASDYIIKPSDLSTIHTAVKKAMKRGFS